MNFLPLYLWAANAAMAGVLLGFWLGGGRWVFFGTVLSLGLLALWAVRKFWMSPLEPQHSEAVLPWPFAQVKEMLKEQTPAEDTLPGAELEILSPEKAREWLDMFLLTQQGKKK